MPAWRETAAIALTKEYALDARRGGPFGIEWMIGDEGPHALAAGSDDSIHDDRRARMDDVGACAVVARQRQRFVDGRKLRIERVPGVRS